MGTPNLVTSHTNNKACSNAGHGEGSNNNDNRVIVMGVGKKRDPWSGVPLDDTANWTPCSGGAVNPVGAENGVRIYKKN